MPADVDELPPGRRGLPLVGDTWDVPEQSDDYHWNRTPAEPRDGFRIRLTKR
jgi:hypothetical protein